MDEIAEGDYRTVDVQNIKTTDISDQFRIPQFLIEKSPISFRESLRRKFSGSPKVTENDIRKPYAAIRTTDDTEIIQPPTSYRATIEKPSKGYFWTDEHGTPFGAHISKGGVMLNLKIERDDTDLAGYRVHGLDSGLKSLPHRIFASQFFREHGLATERYTRVQRIEEFIYHGESVDLRELKTRLLHDARQNNPKLLDREMPQVAAYINDPALEFFIVDREVQTALRLRDLMQITDSELLKWELEEVFSWVNHTHANEIGFRAFGENETFKDATRRYFVEWYPVEMAKYLAKMHNLGVTHGFAHSQNWELNPSLVDLDSTKGKPLGTGEVTNEDIVKDSWRSFLALGDIFSVEGKTAISRIISYNDKSHAQAKFAFTYLREANLLPEAKTDQPQLEDTFHQYFWNKDANHEPLNLRLTLIHVGKLYEEYLLKHEPRLKSPTA